MFKLFVNHFINHDSGDLRKSNILAMSLTDSKSDESSANTPRFLWINDLQYSFPRLRFLGVGDFLEVAWDMQQKV